MSRILFVMLHPGFIRYYEDALRACVAGGHHVHLAFEISRTKLGENVTAQRLAANVPGITCGTTPPRMESVRTFLARGDRHAVRSGSGRRHLFTAEAREEAWESLATTVRLLMDYLRFFHPAFASASALRGRAEKRLPRVYRGFVRGVARAGVWPRSALAAFLRAMEQLVPPNAAIEAFLRNERPDLLLVTPLIELGSQQVDYVKAARRLGIRSAHCVASWDNLTSKGLIRVVPDHVVVWNEAQKREAVSLHDVPEERVVITGASVFDRWFDARPTRTREEFCRTVGLEPAEPFVLYVGSSSFIAPEEVPFFERWLSAIRAEPALAGVGVLVRPHPANARQWRALDPAVLPNVAVWPAIGTDPNAPDFARDFFESLHFSHAVVGINTSAQIEAGIVGRPVFTVRADEFAHAQEGTLHFRHLLDGLVSVADGLAEHVRQLRAVMPGGPNMDRPIGFLESFVRPHGLDTKASSVFAEAIQHLQALPAPSPVPEPLWVGVLRPGGALLALVARTLADDRSGWAYVLRPVVTMGVWCVTAVHGARRGGELAALLGKRMRRATWRAWYESSQRARKSLRHLRKPVVRAARHAGGAARRAARRVL